MRLVLLVFFYFLKSPCTAKQVKRKKETASLQSHLFTDFADSQFKFSIVSASDVGGVQRTTAI